MGFGATIRKEQASDYFAQVRTRGILTDARQDFWHLAMGPLRVLFRGTPPLRRATVQSARVLGPHPSRGSPFYFSEAQAERYSPGEYLRNSWLWRGYARTLKRSSVLPTIIRCYGWAAETLSASDKGWHGFFVETPHGPRFSYFEELRSSGSGVPMGVCLAFVPHPGMAILGKFNPALHGVPKFIGTGSSPPGPVSG